MGHRYENLWHCVNRQAVADGFINAMIQSPGNQVLWLTAAQPTVDGLSASDPELFGRVLTLVHVFTRLASERNIPTPAFSGGLIGGRLFHAASGGISVVASAQGLSLGAEIFGRELEALAITFSASIESLTIDQRTGDVRSARSVSEDSIQPLVHIIE